MKRLLVGLILVAAPAWAQKPTVIISGDGSATVVSVGTQGPAGANIPAGGVEGNIAAKVGGGFGWTGAAWHTGLDYTFDLPVLTVAGCAAPGYGFVGDPTTGFCSSVAGTVIIRTTGTDRLTINSTAVTSTLPIRLPAGTAAAKSLAWSTAPGTGLYLPDQTSFLGTLILGSGGGALNHTVGADGQDDTFVGIGSGFYNTTGSRNSAYGMNSLALNTTGSYNSGFGYQALLSNLSGTENVGIGRSALYTNSTGNYNTGIGSQSLYLNTAASNTAMGYQSLYSNTTGSFNVAMGELALRSNVGGSYNTGVGRQALYDNSAGNTNVAVGMQAGYQSGATPTIANAVTTGSSLTFVGYQAGLASPTQRTNSTAIGYQAYVGADNTVVLGDENVIEVKMGSAAQAIVKTNVGIQGGAPRSLSDNVATTFATMAIPQTAGANYGGGRLIYTIFCKDATNQATQSGTVTFACHNLAGTESCAFGTPDGVTLGDVTASLSNPVFTAAGGGDLVTFSVQSDCIGITPTTHTIESRPDLPHPNTYTPIL